MDRKSIIAYLRANAERYESIGLPIEPGNLMRAVYLARAQALKMAADEIELYLDAPFTSPRSSGDGG